MSIFVTNELNLFLTYYPIVMSFFWLIGALFFKLDKRGIGTVQQEQPSVSVLVPAFNEAATITKVVTTLLRLNYQNYEIILINDHSTDQTFAKMRELQQNDHRGKIRIINQAKNGGKARALNAALKLVKSEYVYVVDADASAHRDALSWLVKRITSQSALGAVTGRPIIQNRTSLLGRVQALEYIGIIGNIKEAQTFYLQRIMSISGVSALYRATALRQIGGFNVAVMTEDIDATWRLYDAGWLVGYEPRAYTYILGPESVRGLLKQRSRWAIGGLEVLIKQYREFAQQPWQGRAMLLEMLAGHVWAWLFIISIVQYVESCWLTREMHIDGVVITIYLVCGLLQFYVGMLQYRESVQINLRDLIVLPAYIFYYWLLNVAVAISAEFVVLFKRTGDGKWASSDRGL